MPVTPLIRTAAARRWAISIALAVAIHVVALYGLWFAFGRSSRVSTGPQTPVVLTPQMLASAIAESPIVAFGPTAHDAVLPDDHHDARWPNEATRLWPAFSTATWQPPADPAWRVPPYVLDRPRLARPSK